MTSTNENAGSGASLCELGSPLSPISPTPEIPISVFTNTCFALVFIGFLRVIGPIGPIVLRLPNVFKGFRRKLKLAFRCRPLFSLGLPRRNGANWPLFQPSSISPRMLLISSMASFSLRMCSFSSSWDAVAFTLMSANLLGKRMEVSNQLKAA